MSKLMGAPPYSPVEPVTEMLHDVAVTDPYRWLEDGQSLQTRLWLQAQTEYARSYLDNIPGRAAIRNRIRELLDVETYDSILKSGNRYIFRKRLPGQEQPCIYLREASEGPDQLLIDPAARGTGKYTAVKPLRLSPDGRLLLYEIKQGGERKGTFEILNIQNRTRLSDSLSHGYLRGFAFAADSLSFFYVHEADRVTKKGQHTVYRHRIGTSIDQDRGVFAAGEGERCRLQIIPAKYHLGFLVQRFLDKTYFDFYLWQPGNTQAQLLIQNAEYKFGPKVLEDGRILALTDYNSPNFRIVEFRSGVYPEFMDVVPTCDACIQSWIVTRDRIYVSYIRESQTQIHVFDLNGQKAGQLPSRKGETVRLIGGAVDQAELLLESQSFTQPVRLLRYSPTTTEPEYQVFAERRISFDEGLYDYMQVSFTSRDGVRIPMFLAGRRDALRGGSQPAILTSYGGHGVCMTPQFSVFVAFLMERGWLFALPGIRGGSELGAAWHDSAKGRNRQVAFNDFLAAAEWLIAQGRTTPDELAIFGGSNSSLLVGTAITQRPDLFRSAICMVPMFDMIRYHLFDDGPRWTDEYGTAEDPEEFAALAGYSPYQQVRDGAIYPPIMIVSGDADGNCNPLHARKMTARLQSASASPNPVILDYHPMRGHSPVLPLSERIEGLADRLAFLCDQIQPQVCG